MQSAASSYRMRPLTALRALSTLLRDPNDTGQVFVIIAALSGKTRVRLLRRLERTAVGARFLRERRALSEHLIDRAALSQLPNGSLGEQYVRFCERHGIAAEGLIEAANEARDHARLTPDERVVHERLRDAHDLWHVVTGYQTDLVGEACVLAFTLAQTRNPGIGLIVLMALIETGGQHAFARKLILEAFLRGVRSAWFPAADWEALLARPLDEVRRELRVGPIPVYEPLWSREVHRAAAEKSAACLSRRGSIERASSVISEGQ